MVTSVIGAILTFAFPMMIRQSYMLGLIARILLGSLHSGWFPAVQGAWGAWAPDEEKDQLIMTGFVGAILGSTGVTSIGGVIVTKYGWSAIFYVSAAMTLLWAILWPGNIHFIQSDFDNKQSPVIFLFERYFQNNFI